MVYGHHLCIVLFFFETYATKIIATLALAGVYALTRCRWAQIVVMALLDVLLVCQLDVFPHLLLRHPGKLISRGGQSCLNFQGKSVTDSLRWPDIVPVAHHHSDSRHGIFVYKNHQASVADSRAESGWAAPLQGFACCSRASICAKEASTSRCSVRQSAYLCHADAPIFSVFGCIWYVTSPTAAEPITPGEAGGD